MARIENVRAPFTICAPTRSVRHLCAQRATRALRAHWLPSLPVRYLSYLRNLSNPSSEQPEQPELPRCLPLKLLTNQLKIVERLQLLELFEQLKPLPNCHLCALRATCTPPALSLRVLRADNRREAEVTG